MAKRHKDTSDQKSFDAEAAAVAAGNNLRHNRSLQDLPAMLGRIEDAALQHIDVHAARRMADIDRRFQRERSAVRIQSDQHISELPQPFSDRAKKQEASWPAPVAAAFAVLAPCLLLAGESGPSIALPIAAWASTLLCLLAVGMLAMQEITRRMTGRGARDSWAWTLAVAGLCAASGGVVWWRATVVDLLPDGWHVPLTLLVVGFISAIGIALFSGPDGRRVSRARREARNRVRSVTVEARERLQQRSEGLKAEAREVLAELSPADREELERAVLAGAIEIEPNFQQGIRPQVVKAPRLEFRFTTRF